MTSDFHNCPSICIWLACLIDWCEAWLAPRLESWFTPRSLWHLTWMTALWCDSWLGWQLFDMTADLDDSCLIWQLTWMTAFWYDSWLGLLLLCVAADLDDLLLDVSQSCNNYLWLKKYDDGRKQRARNWY
jgi:hypothetical protein